MKLTLQRSKVSTPFLDALPMTREIATISFSERLAQQAKVLIQRFKCLFNETPGKLKLNIVHHIETGDATPTVAYRRHFGPRELEEVNSQVEEMLRLNIVEPSNSPWSSPIVLAPKADGSLRFAIDFRKLNAVTRKDSTPVPHLRECLDRLAGSKYFSTIDLKSGFWQVPLHPNDKCKTAFPSPNRGLLQFRVMPFGLCNAPATFTRVMNIVLGDLVLSNQVMVYIDDILIFSPSFESHLTILEEVFRRCQVAGLSLNAKKCSFFQESVKFLGHIVSSRGQKPDPAKIHAITKYPTPSNKNEVHRFMGMANWLRIYVRNFAEYATPLNALLREDAEWSWGEAQQLAFERLKAAIGEEAVLQFPQVDKPFFIAADASDKALGATLLQVDEHAPPPQPGELPVLRPVAFASRSMLDAETRYVVTEKEALALVYATQQFYPYLYLANIFLLSDHRPLETIKTAQSKSRRIQRWAMWLEQFNFNVSYLPGKKQVVADALSRAPACSPVESEIDEVLFPAAIRAMNFPRSVDTTIDSFIEDASSGRVNAVDLATELSIDTNSLRQLQLGDEILGPVLRKWVSDKSKRPPNLSLSILSRQLARLWKRITEIRGVFYISIQNRRLLLVPQVLRYEVVWHNHSALTSAHPGIAVTTSRVRGNYFWPGMASDIRRFCIGCAACQSAKPFNFASAAPLEPINAERPFQIVSADILKMPISSNGNKYVLVITDLFTKWIETVPLIEETAEAVYPALRDWCCRYGIPIKILTDRGGAFEAEITQKLYKSLGIQKLRTAAYHPQCDGATERVNRTLLTMLRAFQAYDNWEDLLQPITFAYRSAPHSSTGFSPYELLYGRTPVLPAHLLVQDLFPSVSHKTLKRLRQILQENWNEAARKMAKAKLVQKQFYDRFTSNRRFEVNDRVLIKCKPRSPKLLPRFVGPFKILKVLGPQTYQLDNNSTHNIEHLKPALPPIDWFHRDEFVPPPPPAASTSTNLENSEEIPAQTTVSESLDENARSSKFPSRSTRNKPPSRLGEWISTIIDSIISA